MYFAGSTDKAQFSPEENYVERGEGGGEGAISIFHKEMVYSTDIFTKKTIFHPLHMRYYMYII